MTHDAVYLANVSSAFLGAIHEAQDMLEAGQRGQSLVEVVRHARELHEIMVEELEHGARIGEHAGGMLHEMGERLRSLEQLVAS